MSKSALYLALGLSAGAAAPAFSQSELSPKPESCEHAVLHAEQAQKEDTSNVIAPDLRNHVARARAALDHGDDAGCIVAMDAARAGQRSLPK